MSKVAELDSTLRSSCLHRVWPNTSSDLENKRSCDAAWDSVYCWPPTPPGNLIKRSCSEVFEKSYSQYASFLIGHVTRECLINGTWSHGDDSNYDECAESFLAYLNGIEEDNMLVPLVHYMLFFGSILSLIGLLSSLAIFRNFRCLRSDRITIRAHLMHSLVLRFILILIISEPFVFGHSKSFRDLDILCKIILVLFLYSTFSSISWMFVQGIFLNISLMADVVTLSTRYQLPIFYMIGWGVPAGFVIAFVVLMMLKNNESCWTGYSDMNEMWILVGPIAFELVINGVFLLNILRILLRKVRNSNNRPDSSQLKAAAKATAILFPVLGLNNLILLYNPGGHYNKYFVLLNSFFGATQGIYVAIVFCFADKEVCAAIRRSINRINARRLGNSNREINIVPRQLTPVTEMFTRREVNHIEPIERIMMETSV